MEFTKISRQSLYALKRKFDEEQEQKRLEEEKLRRAKELEDMLFAAEKKKEEERKRLEALKIKEQQMVASVLEDMVRAAVGGADRLVVDFTKEDSDWALVVVQALRREIPDIYLGVHEYFHMGPTDLISRIKSIMVSWAPGSGRGNLG